MDHPGTIPSTPSSITMDADSKIISDLTTVQEKIALCQSMLVEIQSTTQVDSNESLLAIIGFLEACVPRVRELINVGMTSLKEETLTKCFQVNDDLCKILEDVDHPERVTTIISVSESASSGKSNDNGDNNASIGNLKTPEEFDFDNFGFEEQKQAVAADSTTTTSAAATSTLEDLLAPPSSVVPKPTSSSPNKVDGVKKGGDADDEFDNFFGERADKKNSFSIDE